MARTRWGLSKRIYVCSDCNAVIYRDVNVATNTINVGMANYPELMPVEGVEAYMDERPVKQESIGKRELA